MRRSPKKQAADFVRANDRSLVVAGVALESNPEKPSRGIRYKLASGGWWYLGAEACRLLPDGYPRWSE